jgi:hypothetical protein
MNELPRVSELDPAAEYARTHQSARRVGIEAVESQLFPGETIDVVEIALYVNGRMIHTKTNSATVARLMALLTGLAD